MTGMFQAMLMMIQGMSKDKADAIVKSYPTFANLMEAYRLAIVLPGRLQHFRHR